MKAIFRAAALGLLLAAPASAAENAPQTYTFGVLPQMKADKLEAAWKPFLAEVSKRSGVALTYQTMPSLNEFEDKAIEGAYDFAFLNPFNYAFMGGDPYSAFAREDAMLKGIIVTAKDSPLKNLADLKDKRVAFPSRIAYAAYLMPRDLFADAGVDPDKDITAEFPGTHELAYEAVLAGTAEAAGGIPRTFAGLPEDKRAGLRLLAETPETTPHAFAAVAKVPKETVGKVAAAMISLAQDEAGQAVLKGIGIKKLIKAADADWDLVRRQNAKRTQKQKERAKKDAPKGGK